MTQVLLDQTLLSTWHGRQRPSTSTSKTNLGSCGTRAILVTTHVWDLLSFVCLPMGYDDSANSSRHLGLASGSANRVVSAHVVTKVLATPKRRLLGKGAEVLLVFECFVLVSSSKRALQHVHQCPCCRFLFVPDFERLVRRPWGLEARIRFRICVSLTSTTIFHWVLPRCLRVNVGFRRD